MSTYISVTLNLDSLYHQCVQMHVRKHEDGTSTWRIEGKHDPFYLNGTLADLQAFSRDIQIAIAKEEQDAAQELMASAAGAV